MRQKINEIKGKKSFGSLAFLTYVFLLIQVSSIGIAHRDLFQSLMKGITIKYPTPTTLTATLLIS